MKRNMVKESLRSGGVSLGTIVMGFPSPAIGVVAANAGVDFVLYDTEHSGWDWARIGGLVASSQGQDLAEFTRVPAIERSQVSRALDVGAVGIMAPMVESAEQAANIVAWCHYPPDGVRGAAFGVAHDQYKFGNNVEKMRQANANVMVIAQIETVKGVDAMEEIASVPGIDVLWVGHFDLTNSMGIPGEFENPEYLKVLGRVVEVANAHNVAAGFMVSSAEEAEVMLDKGFRCLAVSYDVALYSVALSSVVTAIRTSYT